MLLEGTVPLSATSHVVLIVHLSRTRIYFLLPTVFPRQSWAFFSKKSRHFFFKWRDAGDGMEAAIIWSSVEWGMSSDEVKQVKRLRACHGHVSVCRQPCTSSRGPACPSTLHPYVQGCIRTLLEQYASSVLERSASTNRSLHTSSYYTIWDTWHASMAHEVKQGRWVTSLTCML